MDCRVPPSLPLRLTRLRSLPMKPLPLQRSYRQHGRDASHARHEPTDHLPRPLAMMSQMERYATSRAFFVPNPAWVVD